MITEARYISIFEHNSLCVGYLYNGVEFSRYSFESLQRFHSETGGLYFDLGFNQIRFKEYVGVMQVGKLTIEVLPKADNQPSSTDLMTEWKQRLIEMLRAIGKFAIHAPSSSMVLLKKNSILHLYFELYIKELEYLIHRGLVRKYSKCESNLYTLKGALLFQKQIQHNHVHHERCYVRHTVYNVQHEVHCILYKALKLLKQINHSAVLHSRIGSLLLHFPEMPDIRISEKLFQRQVLGRKMADYEQALQIARMLLLNFHPDVSKGGNHVLALMFDMNLLWEQFVYTSLQKYIRNKNASTKIKAQWSKDFLKHENNRAVTIRPDIVLQYPSGKNIVIDTKWKTLDTTKTSVEDLRQLYVYHQYYGANETAIVYPGTTQMRTGVYCGNSGQDNSLRCFFIGIKPESEIGTWQNSICNQIFNTFSIKEY